MKIVNKREEREKVRVRNASLSSGRTENFLTFSCLEMKTLRVFDAQIVPRSL